MWLLAALLPCAVLAQLEAPPWRCPELSAAPHVSCSCDLPHTLRCAGDDTALGRIAALLRDLQPPAAVSLLDCTLQNTTSLTEPLLVGVTLHGLVVSSGEIRDIADNAFTGLVGPLQALGLPSNLIDVVPTPALAALPALDRLDLSHNRLHKLENNSFSGLRNLSFLDLSENVINTLMMESFTGLPALRTLRMNCNRLRETALQPLRRLRMLQELDLSGNLLSGPLSAATLPRLRALRSLHLTRNQLSSVRSDALSGLPALAQLSLARNNIDVLEDHAFRSLSSLTSLDLAHNRIVAVSGASLAHLVRLAALDLAHNFLRAVTADVVAPLVALRELRLDDNDIALVARGAVPGARLRRLTLADNPLDCDCALAEFAAWLRNSSLSLDDRSSAVCATPPALENGLLVEVPPDELLCRDNVAASPVSTAHVVLRTYRYDPRRGVALEWRVDAAAVPYVCDAVFVYEEIGVNEVLLESNPLHCNSSQLLNPLILPVSLEGVDLQQGHRYRYCVVLLEGWTSDDATLVLGCSEIIPLLPSNQSQPEPLVPPARSPSLTDLRVDMTSPTSMAVSLLVHDAKTPCEVTLQVFANAELSAQRRLNCSHSRTSFRDLPPGPYRLCASLWEVRQCVGAAPARAQPSAAALTALFVSFSVALVAALACVARRMLSRPKLLPSTATHQCFLAPPQDEQQHSRYVKLQATTKL